jgi:GNAT superfamily N-acetyltransferase
VDVVIETLTEHNLLNTPEWPERPFSCKYCTYWEFPGDSFKAAERVREDIFKRKLSWLRKTTRSFGNCGRILRVSGNSVGYVQYAPACALPKCFDYSAGPTSDGAVLLSCLFISDPKFRRLGLGSSLLKDVCGELKRRGIHAIETFARRTGSNNPSGPVQFYLRNGFRVVRNTSEFPLMRLNLGKAVSRHGSLE